MARCATCAWNAAVSVLNDFVYRAPGIRAALNAAAVCPAPGIGPEPNWFVVSTTTLPPIRPAPTIATSMISLLLPADCLEDDLGDL